MPKPFTGIVKWSDAMFGYRVGSGSEEDLVMDERNNAGQCAKVHGGGSGVFLGP